MVTKIIAVVIFMISLQGFNNAGFFDRFKHSPFRVVHYKEYYRLLTSGFLHGSWVHLLINLFVFWQFGGFVEEYIFNNYFGPVKGAVLYVLLFLLSVVAANIHTTIQHKNNHYYASIGASGAVSAILFSYMLINPWSKIYLYAIIPIYTVVAAVLYLVYSQWASRNSQDHIDHSAHFYGAVFGFFYTIAVNPVIFKYFLDMLVNDFPLK
ncbi:MAG: rhomboid family intramembrane serine protease [Deltaproteobacteria bacterium]